MKEEKEHKSNRAVRHVYYCMFVSLPLLGGQNIHAVEQFQLVYKGIYIYIANWVLQADR